MNSSTEILFSISQIISVLSTIIILVASIILFIKKKTLATWIILISNFLIIITYVGRLVLDVIVNKSSNVDNYINFLGISSIVQNLAYLLFTIGLILLVVTEFSKNKTSN